MTKDEHIAKLREALERICAVTLPMTEAHDVASEALAIQSSSEPPQPGEITDEMVGRAARGIWRVSIYQGYDEPTKLSEWVRCEGIFRAQARAALQAALGAKP